MSESVAQILDQAEHLSVAEQEELAERLAEKLARIPPAIHASHMAEVRRRISAVESGKVLLVSGEEAMQRVRQLVQSARAGGR